MSQEEPLPLPPFLNFPPLPTTSNFSGLTGAQRRINSFGIPFEYVPYGSQRATPDGNNLLFKGYRYYRDGTKVVLILTDTFYMETQ